MGFFNQLPVSGRARYKSLGVFQHFYAKRFRTDFRKPTETVIRSSNSFGTFFVLSTNIVSTVRHFSTRGSTFDAFSVSSYYRRSVKHILGPDTFLLLSSVLQTLKKKPPLCNVSEGVIEISTCSISSKTDNGYNSRPLLWFCFLFFFFFFEFSRKITYYNICTTDSNLNV